MLFWDVVSIRVGLARVPVITPMGEPNTPLAFRRRDACHSKQQAGHVKIVVGSGQDTENPILWCGRLYFGSALIVSTEKSVRAFNQVVISKNCRFRSKGTSKIRITTLAGNSHQSIRNYSAEHCTTPSLTCCIWCWFCLPYFRTWFIESIVKLSIKTKLWMSNAHTTSFPSKISSCYGRLLSWDLAGEISWIG